MVAGHNDTRVALVIALMMVYIGWGMRGWCWRVGADALHSCTRSANPFCEACRVSHELQMAKSTCTTRLTPHRHDRTLDPLAIQSVMHAKIRHNQCEHCTCHCTASAASSRVLRASRLARAATAASAACQGAHRKWKTLTLNQQRLIIVHPLLAENTDGSERVSY